MSATPLSYARGPFLLLGIAVGLIPALSCGVGLGSAVDSADGAPGFGAARDFNLLLVTLDTVRADRIGCYGYDGAATPVIDGLAGHGVRFGQAIAPAPVTLPHTRRS